MRETTVTVRSELGIHARPAALLVQLADRYKAEIWLEKDGERVNGRSILGIMLLAAAHGSQLKLIADGEDEGAALDALSRFFEDGFKDA